MTKNSISVNTPTIHRIREQKHRNVQRDSFFDMLKNKASKRELIDSNPF